MLTKTVKYVDFNGNERTETLNFNLTTAEVTEMEMSMVGGMTATINRIIEAQDMKELIAIFKDLILKSYGVKSLDGRQFIKNDKLREEFSQTQAYSDLFMELATDADAAAKFVEGIMPSDYKNKEKESVAAIKDNQPKAVIYMPSE